MFGVSRVKGRENLEKVKQDVKSNHKAMPFTRGRSN